MAVVHVDVLVQHAPTLAHCVNSSMFHTGRATVRYSSLTPDWSVLFLA
jgi:hypothetical protein